MIKKNFKHWCKQEGLDGGGGGGGWSGIHYSLKI